jgi:hypothetical protein
MTDCGSSHGADAVANPAYDLREHQDLDAQIDDWVAQIGLDAGLLGMERRRNIDHLAAVVRNRLKRIQYQPDLINGFLAQTGLVIEAEPP